MTKCIRLRKLLLLLVVVASLATSAARATFHHMQIEQLILGVNGDNSAQAVQLRLREANEHHVGNSSLWVHDHLGFNKRALIDQFPGDVSNAAAGARVLIVTPTFRNYTSTQLQADFIMSPVPESYLSAGRITFENFLATLAFWSFAYGGDAYLGPTTGAMENDDDGDFGVFSTALPNTGVAAKFKGAAADISTNNAADYMLTTGPTVWTNNAGQQFALVPAVPPVRTWSLNGTGSWGVDTNWSPNAMPNANTHTAVFGNAISAPTTVVTNSSVRVKEIEFNSPQGYGIAGFGNVTFDSDAGNAVIDVLSGSHQFQVAVNLSDNTTVQVATNANLAFNNTLNLAGRTLTKSGSGGLAINGQVISGGGSIAGLSGVISGSGVIQADVSNVSGTIAPGNSPGILTIQGNYLQGADGSLEIELGETSLGPQHDRLIVSGSAELNGTLQVELIDVFAMYYGAAYDILTAASITDHGIAYLLPELGEWQLQHRIVELAGGGEALRLVLVPEPKSVILLVSTSLLIIWSRRCIPVRRWTQSDRTRAADRVGQRNARGLAACSVLFIVLLYWCNSTATAAVATWNINNSGSWNTALNWNPGIVPNVNETAVVFGNAIQARQTVVADTAVVTKGVQFFSPHSYAIAGLGSINLDSDAGDATIEVLEGTHEFQVAIKLFDPVDVAVVPGGKLTFRNRINLNGQELSISPGGQVDINHGQILGGAGQITNAGTLGVDGAGAINGDLQSSGTIDIDLRGTGIREFDSFHVAGAATLSGLLNVELTAGFVPGESDQFTILTAGTLNVDNLALAGPAANLFRLSQVGNSLLLSAAIAGDYNRNGIVDAADYVLWRDTFGSTQKLLADGDKSGTINNGDYTFWRARFGNSSSAAGTAAGAQAVPEPGFSAMLGAISVAALLGVWRRS
jgi:hypothetical protein